MKLKKRGCRERLMTWRAMSARPYLHFLPFHLVFAPLLLPFNLFRLLRHILLRVYEHLLIELLQILESDII